MDSLISTLLSFKPQRLVPPHDRDHELGFVAWLVGLSKPALFVELGIESGNVYFGVCQMVAERKLPTRCLAIGTWQAEALARPAGLGDATPTARVYNDTHFSAFSSLIEQGTPQALDQIEDGTIEMLLIDGQRTIETLRNEYAAWQAKLSDRAIVLVRGIDAGTEGGAAFWRALQAESPESSFQFDAGQGIEGMGILLRPGVEASVTEALRQNLSADAAVLAQTLVAARQTEREHQAMTRELQQLRPQLQASESARKAAENQLQHQKQEVDAQWHERFETMRKALDEERAAHHASDAHAAQVTALAQAMQQSMCWRITAPIRWVGTPVNKTRHKISLARQAVALRGGLGNTANQALGILRREGFQGLQRRLGNAERLLSAPSAVAAGLIQPGEDPYHAWLRTYDPTDEAAMKALKERIENLDLKITFSVVMPVYNPPLDYLEQAIESVQAQVYPHWELCIADDASPKPEVRELLTRLSRQDPRIKLVFREKNGHISAATNSALEIASGEFIALMDNDDLLPPHALAYMALAVHQNPTAGLIYSDEDKVTEDNVRMSPYFKCQFNYELFLSQNMISHFGVYRRSVLEDIGGFRVGYEGAQDWDLALRVIEKVGAENVVHIPRVLYHWRVFPGSTALALEEKDYAQKAQLKSISSHFERIGKPDSEVFPAKGIPGLLRIRHKLPEPAPRVSIIIPTRDRVELLSMCVDSILDKTSYGNYEIIIVDNGSTETKAVEYLKKVGSRENVRVVEANIPFNFSQLNNIGAQEAQGEYLVLMNNDIEITQPDWVEEMLGFASQSDIGCVGAQLWYPNGTLQHGGVVLGIGGIASHAHKGIPRGNFGYFGRASAHQMFSAVTAACLMIRKSIYQEVGGLDESLKVAYNDVDFCLKVRERGYRNLYNPFAQFVHHESASRGSDQDGENHQRLLSEAKVMKERWGALIADDPAYSPNLTLAGDDFAMAWPSRVAQGGIGVNA